VTRREKRAQRGAATNAQLGLPPTTGLWRLRNWRLRTKLFVLLLVPAVAVIALVGLRVKSDLDDAKQLAELAARGPVDSGVAEVMHQLQRERDLTVRFVALDRKGDIGALQAQRQRVDMAIGNFDRTLADSKPRLSPKAADTLRQTEDRLGVLTGLRYSGEHSAFPADAVLRSYSELISGMLDIGVTSAVEISDPQLSRMRLASNALARVKDQMSIKRAIMAEALAQGRLSNDRTRALLGAEADLASARNDYRTFATPDQQRMYDDTVIGMIVDTGNNMVESALTRAETGQPLTGLDPDQWDVSATYTVNLAHQVQQALLVQTQARTDALAAQARTSAIWDSGVVFAVLVVAGLLSVIIARSLLRPLRILRRSALEVAGHQLPAVVEGILNDPDPQQSGVKHRLSVAPVPVFTREELGQVARAFDAVHGEAVRLAGEQAMLRESVNSMFVNLSRRSQELVERQLSVLDRMEADEQDPDTLGGLFELDHLATRMRRNSENLLVLSGTDLGRVSGAPVPADEIIGAAVSEVEHYQRIEIAPGPDIAIVGPVVNDLVHVISELLENATTYSGEDTVVEVSSSADADGSWCIAITDHGAGMPQPEIERTNARLARPPEVDVEVSRRMGLYVVATLARRHYIDVRLHAVEEGGLQATVVVPVELVTEPVPPAELPPSVADNAMDEEHAEPAPLDSPLFPLFEPEPEPEPEPIPAPDAWPLRRAPVVEQDVSPVWPTHDDDPSTDFDEPTERMPAYQDVLSRWFHAGPPSQPSIPAVAPPFEPEPEPEPEYEPEVEYVPEPEPEWPTEAELEREDGAEDTSPALPKRVPRARFADESQYHWPVAERPILSLSPDEVRERMSSLQGGVRRGRHARGDGNSTT
jgi:signal transduction histidine kinase